MIKTLHITGFIALLLLAAFFVFFADDTAYGADAIDSLLKSPTIIEKFKKAGVGKKSSKDEKSPLVKEAEGFANYLNPPAPKAPKRSAEPRKTSSPKPPEPKAASIKFNLIGTSFYASNPGLSLALIDIPGKGLRWVRQSSNVGRMVIEEVKDGVVLVNDGTKTVELKAKRTPKRNLLRSSSLDKGSAGSGSVISLTTRNTKSDPINPLSEEGKELYNKLLDELEVLAAGGKSSDANTNAKIDKLFSEIEAVRVSEAEANNLDKLGKKLKDSASVLEETRKRKKELAKRARTPRKR